MPATFDEVFKAATGNAPYDYQRRLAYGKPGRTVGSDADRTSISRLITRCGRRFEISDLKFQIT